MDHLTSLINSGLLTREALLQERQRRSRLPPPPPPPTQLSISVHVPQITPNDTATVSEETVNIMPVGNTTNYTTTNVTVDRTFNATRYQTDSITPNRRSVQ